MAAIGTVERRSMTLGSSLQPSEVGQSRRINRISSFRWPNSGGLLQSWMLGSSRVPCMAWSPAFAMHLVNLRTVPRSTLQFKVSLLTPTLPWPTSTSDVGLGARLSQSRRIRCWVQGSTRVPCVVDLLYTITVVGLKVTRWSLTSFRSAPESYNTVTHRMGSSCVM